MAVGNVRIITTNQLDAMTLSSVPTAETALPVDNLKRSEKSMVMRVSASSVVITGTVSTNFTATGIFITDYTMDLDVELNITLKLASSPVLNQDFTIDADLIPLGTWKAGVDPYGGHAGDQVRKMIALWFTAPVIYDELVLTIDDVSNSIGYFDVGRVFIGEHFTPTTNMARGVSLEWLDDVKHNRGYGGGMHSSGTGYVNRKLNFNLNYITDAERLELEAELFMNNRKEDLLISGFPEEGGVKEMLHQFIAKREKPSRFSKTHYLNNAISMGFLEV